LLQDTLPSLRRKIFKIYFEEQNDNSMDHATAGNLIELLSANYTTPHANFYALLKGALIIKRN
jgi:hypothetical protein